MNYWFVRVHRSDKDPFNYPYFGKVQYFRTELMYHRFALVEHPDYPGPYRARFIATHTKESMISYIALKYAGVEFEYVCLNDVKHDTASLGTVRHAV
jgi:hypothetical protein